MLIFIDESGSFAFPPAPNRNLCSVGALVIPEIRHNDLVEAYGHLVRPWTSASAEIKGSALNEAQVAAVIDLLIEHKCLFFICATEMSLNSPAWVLAHQTKQAEFMTSDLTREHRSAVRKQAGQLRRTLEGLSSQLYLQAVLLTGLVRKVIDQASAHFAMKDPPENGRFRWFLDGKDKTKTDYEAAWELMAAGLLQTSYIEVPGIKIEEGDYSHFEKNFVDADAKWPDYAPKPRGGLPPGRGLIWNLKKVLYQSMSFVNSRDCVGLQLADIVGSTFRRALMGRIQRPAYDRLGELMPRLGPHAIELHLFNVDKARRDFREYDQAVAVIESRSKLVGM